MEVPHEKLQVKVAGALSGAVFVTGLQSKVEELRAEVAALLGEVSSVLRVLGRA